MQEVLEYLYTRQPDIDSFLQWVTQQANTACAAATLQDHVLSEADLEHWHTHGFVVLRQAVSAEAHQAASNAIWDFLEADPADPASWYKPHPARHGLMVVLTQHPALHAIRQSARIRRAYEQLYGTNGIYLVTDKVSFNPPQNDHYRFAGSPLHWDTSLVLPIPYRLQGLLYLSDVQADGGAFHCVPGFHNRIDQWLAEVPEGVQPRDHAVNTLRPQPVAGNAGDFIIWHQALPHCATPNLGPTPRLVQYLTYIPENMEDMRPWL